MQGIQFETALFYSQFMLFVHISHVSASTHTHTLREREKEEKKNFAYNFYIMMKTLNSANPSQSNSIR